MERTLSHHLTALSAAYASAMGVSLATLSERAAGDWRFFQQVAAGTLNFRIRSYDRAITWFSANWPEGGEWPADVPRPAISVAEASADE
ncbi:MAG: hypothetical protein H6R00_196 [Proteobacteria bacterium]|nr:hypothetical protein [Pseudomonadota bacterium]